MRIYSTHSEIWPWNEILNVSEFLFQIFIIVFCLSEIWRTFLGIFLSIKLLKTNPQRNISVQVRLIDKLDRLFVNNTHRHNSNITVKEDWLSIFKMPTHKWVGWCRAFVIRPRLLCKQSTFKLPTDRRRQLLQIWTTTYYMCPTSAGMYTINKKYWIFRSPPTLYYAEFQNIT